MTFKFKYMYITYVYPYKQIYGFSNPVTQDSVPTTVCVYVLLVFKFFFLSAVSWVHIDIRRSNQFLQEALYNFVIKLKTRLLLGTFQTLET